MTLALMGTAVAEETFGAFLTRLRGDETIANVARRIVRAELDITGSYIAKLEANRVKDPGAGKLTALAEGYKHHFNGSREEAFWEMWRRVGFPLPPGFAELNPATRRLVAFFLALAPDDQNEFEQRLADWKRRGQGDAGAGR